MAQGPSPAGDKGVLEVLKTLGPRSRALSWVLFLVYLIFGVSIFGSAAAGDLSVAAFITAAVCATVVFIVGIVALAKIEMKVEETKQKGLPGFGPSPATPDSAVLTGLVRSTLEVICRATSLPDDPEVAGMRAFIFKVEGNRLVCRYYWALNPTAEEVGVTSFPLDEETSKQVAVVECVMKRKTTSTEVQPLSDDLQERGPVDSDLRFVLAAPIWNETMTEVWGTVDFDASNNLGRERLCSEAAKAAILQLTQHLRVIFNLTEESSADGAIKPAARTRRRARPKAAANGKADAKAVVG